MAHQVRGWCTYSPTKAGWADMSVKVDSTTAVNNGTAVAAVPPHDNYWPGHRNDMRFAYGKDLASLERDTCIVLSLASPMATIGGTFLDMEGNTYTIYGQRAERISIRNLK